MPVLTSLFLSERRLRLLASSQNYYIKDMWFVVRGSWSANSSNALARQKARGQNYVVVGIEGGKWIGGSRWPQVWNLGGEKGW